MGKDETTVAAKVLGTLWWITLIRGIALLVLGFMALIRPGATMVVIMQLFGFFWLVDGISSIVRSIKERKVLQSWVWGLVGGILRVIISLIILIYPLVATMAFTGFFIFMIGFGAILSGLTSIIGGIRLRKESKNTWSQILAGLFTFILGCLVLGGEPFFLAAWFVMTVGILAIIGGLFMTIESFKIRKLSRIAE